NKSNIIAKNIEIKALEDISSSADMKAKENILIKGNNIYLKDTKTLIKGQEQNNGFKLKLETGVNSTLLSIVDNIADIVTPGEQNHAANALSKFGNLKSMLSSSHNVNRIISKGNPLNLVEAYVEAEASIHHKDSKIDKVLSNKGSLEAKNITLDAKNNVELTNQKLVADEINIYGEKLLLKQGKNIDKSLTNSVEVGERVRYDIITQKVSGDARLSYERQKYLGVTYDDNELKAKKLNIKVKKVEKEENKGIEEKDISGFSILAGTNGANINVKKNDTEIGIN
uniref:hypothetical protein n=1 Tax=Oceanivirga salmonicida TaxID=1769291 RepID=UPI0018CC21C2